MSFISKSDITNSTRYLHDPRCRFVKFLFSEWQFLHFIKASIGKGALNKLRGRWEQPASGILGNFVQVNLNARCVQVTDSDMQNWTI